MSTELSSATEVFDVDTVEEWRPVIGYSDYEVSDMGRVRCIGPRKGRNSPFFVASFLGNGTRPVVRVRDDNKVSHTRRIDEILLEAFVGPRPASDHGPSPTNGDRQDVRLDNLSWAPGLVRKVDQAKRRNRGRKRAMAKRLLPVRIPAEIKHGHWLGIDGVMVSVQPNQMVELMVADNDHHHTIPIQRLDDAIRVLQAAKAIIEG